MPQDSRLQFSLRSLFVVTALCAMFFSALRTFGLAPLVAFLWAAGMYLVVVLSVISLRRSISRAMTTDPKSPQRVVSVPSDMHAAPIVAALRGAGIRANAVGSYTSGFGAVAPGEVHVVVAQVDIGEARHVLSRIQACEENVALDSEKR